MGEQLGTDPPHTRFSCCSIRTASFPLGLSQMVLSVLIINFFKGELLIRKNKRQNTTRQKLNFCNPSRVKYVLCFSTWKIITVQIRVSGIQLHHCIFPNAKQRVFCLFQIFQKKKKPECFSSFLFLVTLK